MDGTRTQCDDTYIMYKAEEDEVVEFIGPFFKENLDDVKEQLVSEGIYGLNIIDEQIFKMLYPDQYKIIFKELWINFITSKLESLNFDEDVIEVDLGYDILNDILNQDDNMIISNYMTVSLDVESEDTLLISFKVDADPKLVAIIMKELTVYTYNIYDINVGPNFYVSKYNANDIYHGEDAKTLLELERNYINMN